MKLWLSKNSEIPLRDQITRQVMLAIASGDLGIGDKLPSVRELAIRFKIHQNTVSNAYQLLEETGWVEARKGSGVFVLELTKEKRETTLSQSEIELDKLIEQFMASAKHTGFSETQIRERISQFFSKPKPEKIFIVEPDPNLQRILYAEISETISFDILSFTPDELRKTDISSAAIIAMPEAAKHIHPHLPPEAKLYPIRLNSAQMKMTGQSRPQPTDLIGIVSHLEMFLRWGKTFLLAAGIDSDSVLVRDANEDGFEKGLNSCLFVISDVVTAKSLSPDLDVRIFRLVSEEFLDEIRALID